MSYGIEVRNASGAVVFNNDSVGAFVLATISISPTNSGTWKADNVGSNIDGYGLEIFPMQWQAPSVNEIPNFVSHSFTITYKTSSGTSYTNPSANRYPQLQYAPQENLKAHSGNSNNDSTIYVFARAV